MCARARFSDGLGVEATDLDRDGHGGGYVPASTNRTMTSLSKEQLAWRLPLTVPLRGLRGDGWCVEWLRLRQAEKLVPGKGVPFMPAPAVSGGWTSRALTSSEATCWLKELLTGLG